MNSEVNILAISMDRELAQRMFEEFGALVLLGMPPGTEFGIDVNSWNVGEKFKGVKMIPPGIHFIYFSAVNREGDTAPRTGFFHFFKQKDLVVRHYDAAMEDLKEQGADQEEVDRVRANIRNLDKGLGAYPVESWEKWVSLTQYITCKDLERMMPLSGRICSVPELTVLEDSMATGSATVVEEASEKDDGATPTNTPCELPKVVDEQPKDDSRGKTAPRSMPEMVPRPGTELRFSKFPSRPYREGATPSEITRYSLDSSYSVGKVIETLERPESLLAELQFAFVCFLVGQVWDGWEQWRQLLSSLCSAEELLLQHPQLYLKLLSVIHFQVQEVPEDLFVDIVESDNFLAAALKTLFANVSDNSSNLPVSLVSKAQRFKHHLSNKFKWNLTLEDEGEDAPVVIETENMST